MNCVTELQSNGGVRKLVQVTEEVQKPIHVPVVLGNDCFVITQQDKRKIEDVRVISYHKVGPNGELIPVETVVGQDTALRDAILSAVSFQAQNHVQNTPYTPHLMDYYATAKAEAQTRASIAQQMEWSNSNCTSPAYPFTYSKSTSVGDIGQHKCPQVYCCCQKKYVTNRSCNTIEGEGESTTDTPVSARELLKIRKMTEDVVNL